MPAATQPWTALQPGPISGCLLSLTGLCSPTSFSLPCSPVQRHTKPFTTAAAPQRSGGPPLLPGCDPCWRDTDVDEDEAMRKATSLAPYANLLRTSTTFATANGRLVHSKKYRQLSLSTLAGMAGQSWFAEGPPLEPAPFVAVPSTYCAVDRCHAAENPDSLVHWQDFVSAAAFDRTSDGPSVACAICGGLVLDATAARKLP